MNTKYSLCNVVVMEDKDILKLAFFLVPIFIQLLFKEVRLFGLIHDKFKRLWLAYQAKKMEDIGVVMLLESDVDFVATNAFESFYLTDGDKVEEYENRNTHLDDDDLYIKIKEIRNYYEDLNSKWNDRLDLQLNDKSIPQRLVEIYSLNNIKEAIKHVNNEMSENNQYHFNGDKLGVTGYNRISKDKVSLQLYRTDHFTWQCFKYLYFTHRNDFEEIIFNLGKVKKYSNDWNLLLKSLKFLFSSFGIDILISGRNCKNEKRFLVAARTGDVEMDKESLLHVPVNEAFSLTDGEGMGSAVFSPRRCVFRGIEEELGVDLYENKDTLIDFHDFAIVTADGEIGISAHVEIVGMPIEQIQLYPSQDKYLEIKELISVPVLRHYKIWNFIRPEKKILEYYFYRTNGGDNLSLKWTTFTPLIYQRAVVRYTKLSNNQETFLSLLIAGLIILGINFKYYWSWSDMVLFEQIFDIGTIIVSVALGVKEYKRPIKYYNRLMPFVPQWNGDVKAIQTSGKISGLMKPNKGVNFGFVSKNGSPDKLKLSDLSLLLKPYCSIRKNNAYEEFPISYFVFKKKGELSRGTFEFFKFNYRIEGDTVELKCDVDFKLTENKGYKTFKINNIRFGVEMSDIEFNCNNQLDLKSQFYRKCDEIEKDVVEGAKYGYLSNDFNSNYDLYDLFEQNEKYFYSCIDTKRYESQDVTINLLTKKNDIYDLLRQSLSNSSKYKNGNYCSEVLIKGNAKVFESSINKFVSNIYNRPKLRTLDLFALQFLLIRDNILLADISYRRRWLSN